MYALAQKVANEELKSDCAQIDEEERQEIENVVGSALAHGICLHFYSGTERAQNLLQVIYRLTMKNMEEQFGEHSDALHHFYLTA